MGEKCNHRPCTEHWEMGGLIHYQKCVKCEKIRQYNPKMKKILLFGDPDMWSEWVDDVITKVKND
jgi:hypothetical protein